MSVVIALLLLIGVSFSLSVLLGPKPEVLLPGTLLSAVLVLFPFYCLDLLLPGVLVLLALSAGLMAAAVVRLHREPKGLFSPAICLLLALALFFLLYLKNNQSYRWDELRLWAAMPKALHVSNALQFGEDSLIFYDMRSYPPGMHLLCYLFTFFQRDFHEYQLFVIYALVMTVLWLPALADLRWKHAPLLLPLAAAIVLLPCVLTSHGEDHSYFYATLFIDPILGFLAGFGFYLALRDPFRSRCALWQFCAVLGMLTILKDSGILFALGILACAMMARFPGKRWLIPAGTVAAFWLIWAGMTRIYGIHNHLHMSSGLNLPEAAGNLLRHLWEAPAVKIPGDQDPRFFLNFYGVAALCLVIAIPAARKNPRIRGIGPALGSLALCAAVFLVGMYSIFGTRYSSFSRYVTTLTVCLASLTGMLVLDLLLQREPPRIPKAAALGLGCAALAVTLVFLGFWRTCFFTEADTEPSTGIAREILARVPQEEQDARIYLIMAGPSVDSSLTHHRIYFDLLGTRARIGNFFTEVRIVNQDELIDPRDRQALEALCRDWSGTLEDYDFVYVYSAEPLSRAVFREMGAEARDGHLYRVEPCGSSPALTDITQP